MEAARQILQQYWGFSEFRPSQEPIVEAALAGKDTLALLPTGGGKSICFQVPGLARAGVCVVVSPLIALMQDQVAQLAQADLIAFSAVRALDWDVPNAFPVKLNPTLDVGSCAGPVGAIPPLLPTGTVPPLGLT